MRILLLILFPFFCNSQIVIRDTVINNNWIIPKGTVVEFKGKISGKGMMIGGIIQAGMKQHIFDTSFSVAPEGTYTPDFSICWYGASPSNPDNYGAIQKTINIVIGNTPTLYSVFIPPGKYNFSKPLKVANLYAGRYTAASIKMWGGGSRKNLSTVLNYTGTKDFAFGVQVGKGCEFSGFAIKGRWKAPSPIDSIYYNLKWEDFNDANGVIPANAVYGGFVVDYDGSINSSGSTDIYVHDFYVGGFVADYLISPNPVTANAEELVFKRVAGGECKTIFSGGQAQEKGNRIEDVDSWERNYCVFSTNRFGKTQAGHYMIDGINAAGKTVSLFYTTVQSWNIISIKNVFAEALGRIGTITGNVPISISEGIFNFVPPSVVGDLNRLTVNNTQTAIANCLFRYNDGLGNFRPMVFTGQATFSNCSILGYFKNPYSGACRFINTPVIFQ